MKHLHNPLHLPGWQIAELAEPHMTPVAQLAADFGLLPGEVIPMGRQLAKVDGGLALARLPAVQRAKYIDVSAISPTPLGEGKTTTTIGLVQGLGRLGFKVSGAIRQSSGGPTFNIKGAAAGGGLSQCIPLAPMAMGLTGDMDAITNAHNLAMVALTARMHHEHHYDDAQLAQRSLQRLDIDPAGVELSWVMDFCAQALRHIAIGIGEGVHMNSGFAISASSELMAILAVSKSLQELRERISRIVVARRRSGKPVTTRDLEVDGAMAAWLVNAIHPTLVQTLEGQPVFVHAGPFANIAIGQSSVVADLIGTRLADYHVTESGFAADIGYEKFWNLKCRYSGLVPDAVVVVATVRALKLHGGGPEVRPGHKLDPAYTEEDLGLLEKGCENLRAQVGIVRQSGIRPVVALNAFPTDTEAEVALVRRCAEAAGARFAYAQHWLKGGEGALELARQVAEAAAEPKEFQFLYSLDEPLQERIHRIATRIYGADGVSYEEKAAAKLALLEADPESRRFGICMAKTQYSLSHDPHLRGRPTGWTLPVRDILAYHGAGFIVPVAGDIKLMPGTGSNPAFRKIDIDPETGKIHGLF